MTGYNNADRFHNRKNPRLKEYDYTTPNYYFITICTWEKSCIFGTATKSNAWGSIARNKMESISTHFVDVIVDKYVVMPNHVHAILVLEGNANLSTVVGQYKSAVTKEIHELDPRINVWQTSFYDHIIRNQEDYARIWEYIDTNPARWNDDCFFTP